MHHAADILGWMLLAAANGVILMIVYEIMTYPLRYMLYRINIRRQINHAITRILEEADRT